MKKLLSTLTAGIMLSVMLTTPISASTVVPSTTDSISYDDSISTYATNYFNGSTVKMNSLNGGISTISTISSGSISVGNPAVTTVTLNVTVSSGSSPFHIFVESPNGQLSSQLVSKSGSINISDFKGVDPYGKWKVYIRTTGTVSTATARMKVNYTY